MSAAVRSCRRGVIRTPHTSGVAGWHRHFRRPPRYLPWWSRLSIESELEFDAIVAVDVGREQDALKQRFGFAHWHGLKLLSEGTDACWQRLQCRAARLRRGHLARQLDVLSVK